MRPPRPLRRTRAGACFAAARGLRGRSSFRDCSRARRAAQRSGRRRPGSVCQASRTCRPMLLQAGARGAAEQPVETGSTSCISVRAGTQCAHGLLGCIGLEWRRAWPTVADTGGAWHWWMGPAGWGWSGLG